MYFDLLDAFQQPGCPVCRLSMRSVRRYMDNLFYELVNDPGARDSLLKSHGFCAEHAGLLLETRIAEALGASIIYRNIIKVILENFPKSASESSPIPDPTKERLPLIRKFVKSSEPSGRCPACEQRESSSDRAIAGMVKSLHDDRLRAAFQDSDGLCFPHMKKLLDRTQGSDTVIFLLKVTQEKLDILQSQMGELIRKNDYRFQSEGISDLEGSAWAKAMCMISGAAPKNI
jgi:hypothetical protein